MKHLLLTLLGAMLLSCPVLSQEAIRFNEDQCDFCGMIIADPLHAAQAIHRQGTIYNFDAIEGLVNFLKTHEEGSFDQLWVADYGAAGQLVDARKATYLRSDNIPSPMGAYLSGFGSYQSAEQVRNEKGGELLTWSEVKQRFKDSRFGILDRHHHEQHYRPDAYAPIGIMGDHLHHKGSFMLSFRYMRMSMKGNRQGDQSIGTSGIHENYMLAPQEMAMDMYMLGAMFAPTDRVTVMVMQHLASKQMDLLMRNQMGFSTASKGLGDTRVGALVGLFAGQTHSFHLNGALSIPTGEITGRDDTPMQENAKLPYAMQLGSGTYDFVLGGTYKGATDRLSWGVQQLNTIRTGENSEGYQFGNRYELNAWSAVKALDWLSISLRINSALQQELSGIDEELNPMMAPPANIMNSGHRIVTGLIGVNLSFQDWKLQNLHMGFEGGLPLYQYYEGIQMNQRFALTTGLRYNF